VNWLRRWARSVAREPTLYNKIQTLDLNSLALFYQVANQESIRKASASLRMPNATVSRKLRSLEQDLGATLLKRNTRGMVLTEAGAALYEHCERIMGEVRDVSLALSEMQSELRGGIRISVPYGFGTDLVAQMLAEFAVKYPRLELYVQATHKWVDVSKESFDLAISVGRIYNENLPAVRLGELARGVYASTEYCRLHGEPQVPADLVNFDYVPTETQLDDGFWTFKPNGRTVSASPARITVTDVVVARHMAVAGLGFAILPVRICDRLCEEGKLKRVLHDWKIPPLMVTATFVERRYMPRRVRVLLDFISEKINAYARP
jgi:DNA-binding transcriptional LysR family regulator